MPMSWDAAADAKLFTVVMAVYDIKISGAQNERIAKLMGDDVTPKAITHRLSKIKSQASSFTRSGPSTPSSSSRKTPASSTKTSKTFKGSNIGKGAKDLGMLSATHTRTTIMTDNGEDDEEDFDTPTKLSHAAAPTNFLETIKRERESGVVAKKRKIGPKIEDFGDEDEEVVFGAAREEDAEEGNGDAIDFSLHYPAAAVAVKMEEGGDVVDLTDEVGDNFTTDTGDNAVDKGKSKNGKGKEKMPMGESGSIFDNKVKKEVIDLGDMDDEDNEMVV